MSVRSVKRPQVNWFVEDLGEIGGQRRRCCGRRGKFRGKDSWRVSLRVSWRVLSENRGETHIVENIPKATASHGLCLVRRLRRPTVGQIRAIPGRSLTAAPRPPTARRAPTPGSGSSPGTHCHGAVAARSEVVRCYRRWPPAAAPLSDGQRPPPLAQELPSFEVGARERQHLADQRGSCGPLGSTHSKLLPALDGRRRREHAQVDLRPTPVRCSSPAPDYRLAPDYKVESVIGCKLPTAFGNQQPRASTRRVQSASGS